MSETVAAPRVLIMGVGNILLRDEGFGVAAVNHLEKNYYWPENVRLQEGATQGLLLMSELEECDLLVVLDVVLGGKEPGTVYLLENEDLSRSLSFQGSMHQTDLLQTLQVCELAGCRPQCLAFGLQPFDWRTMQVGLSPEAEAMLPVFAEKVVAEPGPARHRGPPERNGLSGTSGRRPLIPAVAARSFLRRDGYGLRRPCGRCRRGRGPLLPVLPSHPPRVLSAGARPRHDRGTARMAVAARRRKSLPPRPALLLLRALRPEAAAHEKSSLRRELFACCGRKSTARTGA